MANQNFYIRRQESDRFLAQISQTLRQPTQPPALLHVYGFGGVGKTRLLEEMQAANNSAAYFAEFCFGKNQETQTPLPLMAALYDQIPEPSIPGLWQRDVRELKPKPDPFLFLYEAYQQGLHQLATQPATAQGGVNWRKSIAMAAVAPLASSVDLALTAGAELMGVTKEISQATEQLSQLLQQHPATKNKQDLQTLLLQPLPRLTKAFVEGLQQKAQQRPVVLVLDTYEKAPNHIDFWLCQYLLEQQNLMATKIQIVVAGRHSLTKQEYWRKLQQDRSYLYEQPLERFDRDQTATYLQAIGIVAPEKVANIYQVTRGLPYYLDWIRKETLAGKQLNFYEGNREIVGLLLQGLTPQQKRIIQFAACCRWFDRSLIEYLLKEHGLTNLQANNDEDNFDWLTGRDFVECPETHFRLDDVARDVFRLSFWQEDEERFYRTHSLLADYFQQRANRKVLPDSPPPAKYDNAEWCSSITEYLYHLLFADRPEFQKEFISYLFASRYLNKSEVVEIPVQAILAEASLSEHRLLSQPVKQFLIAIQPAVDYGWFVLEEEPIHYEWLEKFGFSQEQIKKALELCFSQLAVLEGLSKFAALLYQARRCPKDRQLGWLQQAQAQAKQIATAADPEFSSGMFLWDLGNAFYNLGRYEEAIAAYEEAVKIKPDKHEAWNGKGIALRKLGSYEEAIAAYEEAVKIKPDKHEAWNGKGIALRKLGSYEEAIAAFEEAVKIKPDFQEAWYNKGYALDDLGRYEEAIAAYEEAVKIKPDDHEAWNNKGVVLLNLGRNEEAIAAFEEAVKIKPDFQEAWYNKGNAFYNLGRYEEAIAAYEEVVKIKPDKHEAWNNKGYALDDLGRYEEAIAAYEEAVKIKPDKHEAWNGKGNAFYSLERYEEAIAAYEEAVKIKPDKHEAWNNKGYALDDLGRYEEAIAAYEEAVKIKPDFHEAWYNKGVALVKLGRNEEAIAAYEEAVKIKPDFHEAWYGKGLVLGNLGRYEEAIAAYEEKVTSKQQLTT